MAMYDAGGYKITSMKSTVPEGEMDALLLGRTKVSKITFIYIMQFFAVRVASLH